MKFARLQKSSSIVHQRKRLSSSLFSFISYLETTIFKRREKNDERREKSTKRNDGSIINVGVTNRA